MKVEKFLRNVPKQDMPKYAVMRRIEFGSEDIAWFWSKRLAEEYIRFKTNKKTHNETLRP